MADDAIPEEILERSGGFGRFQVLLCIIMQLMKTPTVFGVLLMVFSVAMPDWWCADNVVASNVSMTTHTVSMTTYTVSMTTLAAGVVQVVHDDESSDRHISGFMSCQSQNATACGNIIYDGAMNTIVSEWDMACKQSWIPSMIASLQFAGLLLGHVVWGQVADVIGRKKPLLLSLLIIAGSSVVAFFARDWVVFAVAKVLCGFGMGCFLTVQYTLITETTLATKRPMMVGLPSWPLESALFCLLAYLLPDWRKLHVVHILVTAPFFATWWFIPESFRWYMSQNRKEDARKVIQYIAKFNARDIADDVTDAMLSDLSRSDTRGDRKTYTVAHMFKTRRLTKTTLLLTLNWTVLGLVSYGITFGVDALSGSFFLNMAIFNLITVPTHFVAIWTCNRLGRRMSVILWFAVTAIGSLVVGMVQYIDMSSRGIFTNVFAMVAYIGISMAWIPVGTMTLELYPTVIRNIAFGFLNVFARIGAIISPQLAYFDTQVAGFMYILSSIVSVVCIFGTFFLDETNGRKLNDKIETARATTTRDTIRNLARNNHVAKTQSLTVDL